MSIKRFIFTGTPGSGKTSVIEALAKSGYDTIAESATNVIALEQAKGVMHPWEAPDFVDKIVLAQKSLQIQAQGALQFYDRTPFCTYALACYLSTEPDKFIPSPILEAELERCVEADIYQKKVFFFENLGFIEHTEARKISYEQALVFEQIHLDVYKKFGFDVILVPPMPIEERCRFILNEVR